MSKKSSTENIDFPSNPYIEQSIKGSRKISNYIVGAMLTIGGSGFLLASLSSYKGFNLLPFGNAAELLFVPQGLIMGIYGIVALLLDLYLWSLVIVDFGSGRNTFDKNLNKITISRKGLFKNIDASFDISDVKAVKVDISEGLNPRRRLSLVLKGNKKNLPLSGAGELKPILELEEEGALLAKFLDPVKQ